VTECLSRHRHTPPSKVAAHFRRDVFLNAGVHLIEVVASRSVCVPAPREHHARDHGSHEQAMLEGLQPHPYHREAVKWLKCQGARLISRPTSKGRKSQPATENPTSASA
jgi:hypothetical protein